MGTDPAKTQLLPYLQRADELQKHDPLVAYYCRLFAMEVGLKMKDRSKSTNALLVSLINQLEKDKKTVKLSPEDNLHVEGFALNVFTKADKQDRAGRADLNTAKTFYAASLFFEILNQFGEVPSEIEQKQRYSVWKAADIRKALSEGRKPEPGPPGGDEGFSLDENQYMPSTAPTSPPSSFDRSTSIETERYQHPTSEYNHPISPSAPVDDAVAPPTPDSSSTAYPSFTGISSGTGTDTGGTDTGTYSPNGGYNYPPNVNPYAPPESMQYTSSPAYSPSPPESMQYTSPAVPPYSPSTYPHQSHTAYDPSGTYGNTGTDTGTGGYATAGTYGNTGTGASGINTYASASAGAGGNSSYTNTSTGYTGTGTGTQGTEYLQRGNSGAPASAFEKSSYVPGSDKVTESLKAARFAVGALAFDDLPTAISHLRRSLELLTSPSASLH